MKVALITGGQPRFTYDFIRFMHQIKGASQCDLYFTFWKTEWASTEEEARKKIEKILLPNYVLKKVQVVNEPDWEKELPPHSIPLAPPVPETITWWFKRIYCQLVSLSMTFDMLEENYDVVIRYRLDGRLDRAIDVSKLNLGENFLMPNNSICGFNDFKVCDQFAIGTHESMKFYFTFSKIFSQYVPICDPNWINDGINRGNWSWGTEHIIGRYMKDNNKPRLLGDFNYHINTEGRSKFTDKHYHHRIVPDPTM